MLTFNTFPLAALSSSWAAGTHKAVRVPSCFFFQAGVFGCKQKTNRSEVQDVELHSNKSFSVYSDSWQNVFAAYVWTRSLGRPGTEPIRTDQLPARYRPIDWKDDSTEVTHTLLKKKKNCRAALLHNDKRVGCCKCVGNFTIRLRGRLLNIWPLSLSQQMMSAEPL